MHHHSSCPEPLVFIESLIVTIMVNGVAPGPHPKADEIKNLFFMLYDYDSRITATRNNSFAPSTDSESNSPRSAPSLPSLVSSDHDTTDMDTDSYSSTDFSECSEEIGSDFVIGEGVQREEEAKTRPCRAIIRSLAPSSVQSSDDSYPDLVPITPIISKFPFPPVLTGDEVTVLCGKLNRSWYETLLSGVSVDISYTAEPGRTPYHAPYLDDLKYMYALKLVKMLPSGSWDGDNLIALVKEMIWCAIEPQLSDQLSLRVIKRVALFASAVKSAFLELRGEDAYGRFVDVLVDVTVGIFMKAWNIEKTRLLYTHYLPLHVQATIRLTAFVGDLYVCGLMKHVCFRSCFLQVVNHLSQTYEAAMALRVLLEVIGKDRSEFWQIEYADRLLHPVKALKQCGLACNCLTASGITERPGFWEGVRKYRNQYGRMVRERVAKARYGSGRMPSWTYPEGAPSGMVDAELEIMSLQLGVAK
ncbi:hypothetical protein E1B28_012761 [Marasmius oreades]|uniref:Uncharacterized protein n=1 Tax=Marasmius oreades TaxID=181124 RepID=A0A9P7RTI8_9AGAR|nr:uncharacterized protein E1B28_012761 [Marasmius oreades]KAG7088798.1 hypothetical protein E1B28_012761 [Marasmius oreades]